MYTVPELLHDSLIVKLLQLTKYKSSHGLK